MNFFVFDTLSEDGLPAKKYVACGVVASIDITPKADGTYRCNILTHGPAQYTLFTTSKPEPDILQTSGE